MVKRNVLTSLDFDDYEKLKAIADSEYRSISAQLRAIIIDYLRSHYKPRRKKRIWKHAGKAKKTKR